MKKHRRTVKWCVKHVRRWAEVARKGTRVRLSNSAISHSPSAEEMAARSFMLDALADELLRKAGVDDD